LHLWAGLQVALRILEIGTPAQHYLARRRCPKAACHAQADPDMLNGARKFFPRGLRRHGRHGLAAPETLPQIAAEGGGAFDLTFIDADKQSIPGISGSPETIPAGSLIIVDNVVRRQGHRAASHDPDIRGYAASKMLAAEPGVCARRQTVGPRATMVSPSCS
jgi:predicted O-methyltransferase YrrM